MMNAVVALTVLCASTFGAPLSKEKRQVSTFTFNVRTLALGRAYFMLQIKRHSFHFNC